MCNEQRFSESGAPIAPTRCAEYGKLKAENEVLREALNNIYCLCGEGPDVLGGSLLALAAIEVEVRNALKEVG